MEILMISSYITRGVQNMAKGIQNMAGDTKCGNPLAIFCIPTHFVGDTLSGTTPVIFNCVLSDEV